MAAFFTGSQTEQDERDFEEWTKESDRHRAFVDRLLNPEEYEENRRALDKFQVEEAWSKMDKKIGDTKVRKLPSWKWGVRYAAVVLVLLSAGVYYWWNSEEVREEVPVLYQIAAGTTGKIKTITQMIAIPLLLLDNWTCRYIGVPLDQIFLWIAVAMTIISGVEYIVKNRQLLSM